MVKRDDLIHPQISGNKWRKLQRNIDRFKKSSKPSILTFGGAHSNHIAAMAHVGKELGISTIGVIRGGPYQVPGPTLVEAAACGMELRYVDRSDYRRYTSEPDSYDAGDSFVIPEGGANEDGVAGCIAIVDEIGPHDLICVASGTGTTAAGLLKAGANVLAVSVHKGGEFLKENILRLAGGGAERLQLETAFHFGGYARTTPELIEFMQALHDATGLKTDPIYTGKMCYAVMEGLKAGRIDPAQRIVLIHTGGLQGIRAMETKLGKQIY